MHRPPSYSESFSLFECSRRDIIYGLPKDMSLFLNQQAQTIDIMQTTSTIREDEKSFQYYKLDFIYLMFACK